MRLAGKIAVVVGAGQSPGEGIGNGRATVLRFAQEGAKILAVDRDLVSAEETAVLAAKSGGECVAFQADVTREATLAAAMATAIERWGRIDILHNNVGVSIAGGDKPLDELTEVAFDRVSAINLRGTIMACKHVLPVMRRQRSGAISISRRWRLMKTPTRWHCRATIADPLAGALPGTDAANRAPGRSGPARRGRCHARLRPILPGRPGDPHDRGLASGRACSAN